MHFHPNHHLVCGYTRCSKAKKENIMQMKHSTHPEQY